MNLSEKKHLPYFTPHLFYISFLVAHIALVWSLPYFPTQDGPSHIYNLAILQDLLNGGKEWGEYFSYNLRFSPNWGFNLLAYPLLLIAEPIAAERVFLSIYIVLIGITVPLHISTFSPHRTGSHMIKFLVFPVLFNFTLMLGFYSYVIAVPAFLAAIAMAWKGRDWPWPLRFFCYNVTGVLIFCLHLIPFVFYLIALTIFSIIDQGKTSKSVVSLVRLLIGILPLVIMLLYYLASGSSSLVPSDLSYLYSVSRAQLLLASFVTFSMVSFSPWQMLPFPVFLFALLLLFREGVKDYVNSHREMFPEQKAMLLLVIVLTALYFVSPEVFGGGGYFNYRFPWVILLLLLPLLAGFYRRDKIVNFLIVVAASLSLCTNAVVFKLQSDDVSTFMGGLDYGCTKGELVLLYKTTLPEWSKIDIILHAPSYYGLSNGCVNVGNYETAFEYFPVHFNSNLASVSTLHQIQDQTVIDFSQYPELDSVLGWELLADSKEKLQKNYDMSFANEKLTLWRQR